jgi:hypothetical protein
MSGASMIGRNENFHNFSLEIEIQFRARRWEDNIKIGLKEIWSEYVV